MKHPIFVAMSAGLLWLLVSGVGYEAYAAQSLLVVRVTTHRPVYRLRRPVRITLTETNTSDHEVAVAIGCQILHSSITRDGETVWTFHDYRVQLEPGIYVVHAGVDGVTGTATIRLRRRRASTS